MTEVMVTPSAALRVDVSYDSIVAETVNAAAALGAVTVVVIMMEAAATVRVIVAGSTLSSCAIACL